MVTKLTGPPTSPIRPTQNRSIVVDSSINNPNATPLDLVTSKISTIEVVKLLKPSVVQIVSEIAVWGFENSSIPSKGVGSGIILDRQGHILTNHHVIQGAQQLTVQLESGESLPAKTIGYDHTTDLAIIRVQSANLKPAKLGFAASVEVGQNVVAIGHALGLLGGPTVSKGVVSALGRSINIDKNTTIVDLIQTDASINPGNSGGPLVNDIGEIIGINTAIAQGGEGIGFAINIDDAKVVVRQLIDQGFVRRGFLGIVPVNVTRETAFQMGLGTTECVLISKVIEGTAAQMAGLQPKDVIVKLAGSPIRNTGELSKFLINHRPGETVDLVVRRGPVQITAELTLQEKPR